MGLTCSHTSSNGVGHGTSIGSKAITMGRQQWTFCSPAESSVEAGPACWQSSVDRWKQQIATAE